MTWLIREEAFDDLDEPVAKSPAVAAETVEPLNTAVAGAIAVGTWIAGGELLDWMSEGPYAGGGVWIRAEDGTAVFYWGVEVACCL